MGVNLSKKGVRVLGVAESFVKGFPHSVLAGVVMRKDLMIDGFCVTRVTVGGDDSTEKLIEMVKKLGRDDLGLLLLNGCIISWFNIIDLGEVHKELGLPLICVTYRESKGIDKYLREYFRDWEKKHMIYKRLGGRAVATVNGYPVFYYSHGLEKEEVERFLAQVTKHGRVPEPIRVARLLARTLRNMVAAPREEMVLC
ncbi:MAG: DUF99 domain-containing protein [Methanobacteriota archaeon]|nr:MAG: DUF99 domain-containing protein [Euryarchaeota archaeon]